jgi:hypothetical protein
VPSISISISRGKLVCGHIRHSDLPQFDVLASEDVCQSLLMEYSLHAKPGNRKALYPTAPARLLNGYATSDGFV